MLQERVSELKAVIGSSLQSLAEAWNASEIFRDSLIHFWQSLNQHQQTAFRRGGIQVTLASSFTRRALADENFAERKVKFAQCFLMVSYSPLRFLALLQFDTVCFRLSGKVCIKYAVSERVQLSLFVRQRDWAPSLSRSFYSVRDESLLMCSSATRTSCYFIAAHVWAYLDVQFVHHLTRLLVSTTGTTADLLDDANGGHSEFPWIS